MSGKEVDAIYEPVVGTITNERRSLLWRHVRVVRLEQLLAVRIEGALV